MKILDISRFSRALAFSMDGLRTAFKNETACQQELIMLFVLSPVACFLPVSFIEKIMLISSLLVVLMVEILNTAIETVINLVSPAFNPLAKYAKDLGSAAVLLSLVLGTLVWGGILGHRYL